MTSCMFTVSDGWKSERGCASGGVGKFGSLDLCKRHRARVIDSFVRELHDRPTGELRYALARGLDEEAILAREQAQSEAVHEYALERVAVNLRGDAQREERRAAMSLIYYVERDGYVKIGRTAHLRSRLTSLAMGGVVLPDGVTAGPVTLLASHPGYMTEEADVHALFAVDRVAGEWFRKSDALMAHIGAVSGGKIPEPRGASK